MHRDSAPGSRRDRAVVDFWVTRTVDELAADQGVEPVESLSQLLDPSITEEEAAAYFHALSPGGEL